MASSNPDYLNDYDQETFSLTILVWWRSLEFNDSDIILHVVCIPHRMPTRTDCSARVVIIPHAFTLYFLGFLRLVVKSLEPDSLTKTMRKEPVLIQETATNINE